LIIIVFTPLNFIKKNKIVNKLFKRSESVSLSNHPDNKQDACTTVVSLSNHPDNKQDACDTAEIVKVPF